MSLIASIFPDWAFLVVLAVIRITGIFDLRAVRIKFSAAELAIIFIVRAAEEAVALIIKIITACHRFFSFYSSNWLHHFPDHVQNRRAPRLLLLELERIVALAHVRSRVLLRFSEQRK